MEKNEIDLEKFVTDVEEKFMAVIKESIKDLVEEASMPVQRGGKMPVDTGFLRSSGAGAINQMPEGEIRGEHNGSYSSNPTASVSVKLPHLKKGDTFYFGWSAIYARAMNLKYGFLDSVVQKWSDIVRKNVERLKE